MKKIANFLSFVEIKTKLASILPFLAGVGYTLYRYGKLDIYRIAVFFCAMVFFDLTATAINNHVGTREQKKENHYPDHISFLIIFGMLISASVLGIYLVSITNFVVLLTGMFCFGVGILYSFGPLPIARTPFGEVVSGAVQGTCIPFLVYIIHDPGLLSVNLELPRVTVSADLGGIFGFGIFVFPMICCIANIMLANNICDLEEDVKVKRYTLPYYLGREVCLKLFGRIYIAAFVFIGIGIVTGILPSMVIIAFAVVGPVMKNIQAFRQKQVKTETFEVSIKNFMLILVPYVVGIWLSQILHILFGMR